MIKCILTDTAFSTQVFDDASTAAAVVDRGLHGRILDMGWL